MPAPTTFHVPFAFSVPHAAVGWQDPTTSGDRPNDALPRTGGGAGVAPQGPDAPPAQQPCGSETFLLMGAMLVAMYFLVMRPEQKRRKEQQNLLASIKQGDRVVTVSGMHGVVAKLTDKTVTLRVDTVQVTFDRVAVARIERDELAPPAKG